jgi:hypothetical protein
MERPTQLRLFDNEIDLNSLADYCLSSIDRHVSKRVNLGGVSLGFKSESKFALDKNPTDFAMEPLLAARIPLSEIVHLNPPRITP